MIMHVRTILAPLAGWLALAGLTLAADYARDIRPLLEQHCYDCHAYEEQPEGGVNLEVFETAADVALDRGIWKSVYDKIESRQMPPPKSGDALGDDERRRLLAWITEVAAAPDPKLGARDPGQPTLRRLTRLEYNNTIRDLFALEVDLFQFPERFPLRSKDYFQPAQARFPDRLEISVREYGAKAPVLLPSASLPGDNRAEHGFRNRGDGMSMSPLLIEKYVALAGEIVSSPQLAAQSPLFARLTAARDADLDDALRAFVTRAFRRPATAVEVERYASLVQSAEAAGAGRREAAAQAVQAVLAAPSFLYLTPSNVAANGHVVPVDDFELASRLSYFLWSSMPDEALLARAAHGELQSTEILESEVARMLADPKCRELSESFAIQWLRLDQLYTAKPDRELYPGFYNGPQGKDTLHAAEYVEALLLFETVLVENRSLLDFIDADYAWLNPRLAQLYQIELPVLAADAAPRSDVRKPAETRTPSRAKPSANAWVRVSLTDRTRGGYLTMAGPLTITSLPFRTSPVKRGAWILETIFARPPSEPKVAFAIEDDAREAAGTVSIRRKFELHRDQAACYSCHSQLDPPGFALEAFDPIGRWRTHDGAEPVDATGVWETRAFQGPAEFKAILRAAPSAFTRGFIEHLLSYALGRPLEIYDMPTVAEIDAATRGNGHRLRDVIAAIATSYPFRHRRGNIAAP